MGFHKFYLCDEIQNEFVHWMIRVTETEFSSRICEKGERCAVIYDRGEVMSKVSTDPG